MLLAGVFPIIDVRDFVDEDTGRISPVSELIHLPLFGAIVRAHRRFVPGSPAEGLVCPSENAFRFAVAPPPLFRCVFRELCLGDELGLRFELGLGSREALRGGETPLALLQAWCESSAAVRTATGMQVLEPMYAGRFLARLYGRGSTYTQKRPNIQGFWVSPGDPAFIAQGVVEEFSNQNTLPWEPAEDGIQLAVLPFRLAGRDAKLFLIVSESNPHSMQRASLLRAKLSRLHTQRESVKTVLSHLSAGYLAPKRDGAAFQALNRFLNNAVRSLQRSIQSFPPAVFARPVSTPAHEQQRRVLMAPALDVAMRDAGILFNVRHKSVDWYGRELGEPAVPRSLDELPTTKGPARAHTRGLPPIMGGVTREPPTGPEHLGASEVRMRAMVSPVGITEVEPGQEVTFLLDLRVDQGSLPAVPAAGVAGGVAAVLGAGVASVDLVVTVSSQHFRQIPGEAWLNTIRVERSGPTPGQWLFRGLAAGDRAFYQLDLSFYVGGTYQRTLSLRLPRRGQQLQTTSAPLDLNLDFSAAGQRRGARLLLEIAWNGQVHQLQWTDTKTKQQGHDLLAVNTDLYFTDLANDPSLTYAMLRRKCRNFLWDLPPALRELLQSADLSGQAISVTSSAPIFPIELLPLEGDRPLLGMDRPVYRWVSGITPPELDGVPFKEMACIRPEYGAKQRPLPDAADEQAFLEQHFALTHIKDEADLETLLSQGHTRLIHFAGHAVDSPPKLFMSDDSFVSPDVFWDRPLMKERPFIFINGCKAGMARPGQPAARANMMLILLSSRCSGAVAPLIEVYSPAAKSAAQAFYQAILSNQSVGEATVTVRRLALSDPDRAATYASYLSYAPPGLTLRYSASTSG